MVVFLTPQKQSFSYVLQMHFYASNNAVEYEALLHKSHVAASLGVNQIDIFGDSALVINQINKEWSCVDDMMIQYCQEVRKLENKNDGLRFAHIPRDKNGAADELSKLGSSRQPVPPGIFFHIMDKASVKFKQLITGPTLSTDVAAQEPEFVVGDID